MIPGWIIMIATFPGVIVHELAHQLFCRWMRVAVFEVCYFRIGNPSGYVVHEPTKSHAQNIVIGIGPFLVNTILGAAVTFSSALSVYRFHNAGILDYILAWLGISIAMHAFPSTGDAQSIWAGLKAKNAPLWLMILTAPIIGLIYIGALGSFLWLDYFYGAAVALFTPTLVVMIMTYLSMAR
jgi:hypothetical protein